MQLIQFSLLCILISSCAQAPPQDRLARIEADIERAFPGVGQVPPDELARRLAQQAREPVDASTQGIVLFDVREPEEFAVGHLPGAVRMDPGARTEDVLIALKSEGAGACPQVVFYCSVGVRSSILAERARDGLKKAGCPDPGNLRGGVFAWHNQQRMLVNAKGPTSFVHPYDRRWGRLLIRQDAVMLQGLDD